MRSLPALAAEYGERGVKVSVSLNEPCSIEPYTSSVEMCTKRPMPTRLATSQSTLVPEQLVRTNEYPSLIDRTTWVSAAKCTTASWPSIAASTSSSSQMSECTNSKRRSS